MSRCAVAGSCVLSLALGVLAACSAGNAGSDESTSSTSSALTTTHPVYDDYQPPPPKPPPVIYRPKAVVDPLPGCTPVTTEQCTGVCDTNFTGCTFDEATADTDAGIDTQIFLTDPTGASLPCTAVYAFDSYYEGATLYDDAGASIASPGDARAYYVAYCTDTAAVEAWATQVTQTSLLDDDTQAYVSVGIPAWYPNNPANPSAPQVTSPIQWVPRGVPYEANLSSTQPSLTDAATGYVYLRFRVNGFDREKCNQNGTCDEPIGVFDGCSVLNPNACESVAPPPVEPTPVSGTVLGG